MEIEHEEWRPVEIDNGEYRDFYAVSSIGRVIRYKDTKTRYPVYRNPHYHVGYPRISLNNGRKKRKYFVHHLVADAFIESNVENPVVNHKDRQRWNNRVSNLEYSSISDNNKHWHYWTGSTDWQKHDRDQYIEWLNKKQNRDIPDALGITKEEQRTQRWRPINGYPDYAVSDKGLVGSLKNGRFRYLSARTPLKYRSVQLHNGGGRRKMIAVLVAEAFIGEIPKGHEVHHISGNTHDNRVENLKIVSQKEHWEEHGFASDEAILKAMRMVEKGVAPKIAAERTGLKSRDCLYLYLKGNKRAYLHEQRRKALGMTSEEYIESYRENQKERSNNH